MSHAVVRGEPTESQLYLDGILDEILRDKGVTPDVTTRERVTLAEIIYHCLRKKPDALFMTNGATGESITNDQILRRSVSLARSIVSKGARGKTVLVVMRNHQYLASVYWAVLFAGVTPFLMDPVNTVFELKYFIKLIEPEFIFCDREQYNDIQIALDAVSNIKSTVVISDDDQLLNEFANGYSDALDNFQFAATSPESTVMMCPTSGSTGLPKAVCLTNRGLVAQLPITWTYHTHFPTPTDLVMLLTTVQWMTFTMSMTTCAVYHIPLLMTPEQTTVEHVTLLIEKFGPTWTFFGPPFAKALLETITSEQLSSLKTVLLLGTKSSTDFKEAFKAKLPPSAYLGDAYGTTETQGYIGLPDTEAPLSSNGRVVNILHYKVLDENGVEVTPGNNGELYVKSECNIKTYYKDEEAYNASFFDGWYRTGDWFHLDVNERLHYIERIKFNFKFRNCHVSPEEVEAVIGTVPGVLQSVVCPSEAGPAAAIVLQPNCDVTKDNIHHAVDSALSEHKRLHGGIVFVDSLPYTPSGKLKRGDCKKMIHQLIESGQCC